MLPLSSISSVGGERERERIRGIPCPPPDGEKGNKTAMKKSGGEMNDRDQAERDSLCFVLALGGGGGGGLELHVSRVGILGASANILTENVKRVKD